MSPVLIALAVSVALVLFAAYWLVARRYRPDGKELAVVAEIPETGLFGVVLILLGFVMAIGRQSGMMVNGTPIGGDAEGSDTFIAGFTVVLVLAGVYVLLLSFTQRTIAYEDRLVAHSAFGAPRSMPWRAVTSVKVQPMSQRATFKSAGESISVNGKREEYLKLVEVALRKVPGEAASDDLGKLLRRLARK